MTKSKENPYEGQTSPTTLSHESATHTSSTTSRTHFFPFFTIKFDFVKLMKHLSLASLVIFLYQCQAFRCLSFAAPKIIRSSAVGLSSNSGWETETHAHTHSSIDFSHLRPKTCLEEEMCLLGMVTNPKARKIKQPKFLYNREGCWTRLRNCDRWSTTIATHSILNIITCL